MVSVDKVKLAEVTRNRSHTLPTRSTVERTVNLSSLGNPSDVRIRKVSVHAGMRCQHVPPMSTTVCRANEVCLWFQVALDYRPPRARGNRRELFQDAAVAVTRGCGRSDSGSRGAA